MLVARLLRSASHVALRSLEGKRDPFPSTPPPSQPSLLCLFFPPLYGRLVLLLLLLLIIIMHQRRSHTVKKWIVITHLHHHKEGEHFSFPFIRLEIQFQFQHVESMASQWIRFGLKVSYTTITQGILKNFNRWVLFVVLPTDNNSITTDDDDNDGLEPWQQQQKQEWIITNKTIYCTVLESARALICIRR